MCTKTPTPRPRVLCSRRSIRKAKPRCRRSDAPLTKGRRAVRRTEDTGARSVGQPHLLQELPEDGHALPAVLPLHHVLEVLHRDPPPARPHLRAVDRALPGQPGQEGRRVTVHNSGHRVGADPLVFADEAGHRQQGLLQVLGERTAQGLEVRPLTQAGTPGGFSGGPFRESALLGPARDRAPTLLVSGDRSRFTVCGLRLRTRDSQTCFTDFPSPLGLFTLCCCHLTEEGQSATSGGCVQEGLSVYLLLSCPAVKGGGAKAPCTVRTHSSVPTCPSGLRGRGCGDSGTVEWLGSQPLGWGSARAPDSTSVSRAGSSAWGTPRVPALRLPAGPLATYLQLRENEGLHGFLPALSLLSG